MDMSSLVTCYGCGKQRPICGLECLHCRDAGRRPRGKSYLQKAVANIADARRRRGAITSMDDLPDVRPDFFNELVNILKR